MRADSVSHLIHHPIRFEFFLFAYLVCTLLLQKINIYKTVRGGHYLKQHAPVLVNYLTQL